MDEVRQLWAAGGEALAELWIRRTDEPGIRDVEAARIDVLGGWLVWAATQEIIRQGSPGPVFMRRMNEVLAGVAGVTGVAHHERQTWLVTGSPSGDTLIRAAAAVVDDAAGGSHQ